MFKNLFVYRLKCAQLLPTSIEEALSRAVFLSCAPTQSTSCGWVAPRGLEHAELVEQQGQHLHLALKFEDRILPSAVVKRRVDEMAAKVEQATGRKPGKKQRKDLAEQATLELLPTAFTRQSLVRVWIDRDQKLLMIDSPSATRAEAAVTLLVKSIEGMQVHLVQSAESPASCMAAWLMDGVPPEGFTIDRECELKSGDEMKSVVRYSRHSLDIDEVRDHLRAGKRPTRLAMSYRDRVSFVLTDTLQVKKIAFLDLAFEGRDKAAAADAFDADAALAAGELSKLIPDLILALGGEHDFFAAEPAQLAA